MKRYSVNDKINYYSNKIEILKLKSALLEAYYEIISLANEGEFKKTLELDLGYIVDHIEEYLTEGSGSEPLRPKGRNNNKNNNSK